MKILHLIPSLTRGGAARSMLALIKYTQRLGDYEHRIVSLQAGEPIALQAAQAVGAAILTAPDHASLLNELEAADIVQLHFWNTPILYDLLRSEWPPLRLISWLHVAGDRPPQIITRALIDFSDYALTTTPYSLELPVFQTLPPDVRNAKAGLIPDGADFERLAGIQLKPHSNFNVGYIGTVDFIKLHPNYVAMSAAIEIPDIQFIVCGSGDGFRQIERQAQQRDAGARFSLRGYVEDIRAIVEVLDVFGYPLCEDNYSTAELVLQEVMYAGVPPVIFARGGAQRVVLHNQTGLIVHSETDYQQAIEYLYHHPLERARLGNTAREYARQTLGAENNARSMIELYRQLMVQPKRRRSWIDRSGRATDRLSGARMFIQALGETAPQFEISLTSPDIDQLLAAERAIAVSAPVLCDAGAGGILAYRIHYPEDAYLRLWAGLVFQAQGRNALAAAEFTHAIRSGCDHWRVAWYLAQAAQRAGATTLADEALRKVKQAAPKFVEAQRRV